MNFIEFISEQKNTHMTHIEDKVLYGGVDGTRQAILALRSLRDMLAGVKDGNVSVKWDGAPAVFAGIDPRDGKFFVAKKGIFNKSPKVYKTNSDIGIPSLRYFDQEVKKYCYMWREGGQFSTEKYNSENDLDIKAN